MDIKQSIARLKTKISLIDAMKFCGVEFVKESKDSCTAKCFLHEEEIPSLSVTPSKSLYHCFSTGCKASGDLLSFYQQFYSLDLAEAILRCAADFGVEVDCEETGEQKARRRLFNIQLAISRGFSEELAAHQEASKFLQARGVSDAVLREYTIGYSKSQASALKIARKVGATNADTQSLEIFSKFHFEGKLIFPVVYPSALGATFYCGSLSRLPGAGPKYVGQSARHPLRWNGQMYGLQQARQAIAESKSVILVEGFFDVLTLASHGIKNVVGMLGSSPSRDQLTLLCSLNIQEATILFDSDRAGEAGVKKVVEGGYSGIRVRVGFLPEGDPDEYVLKHGADALREIISQAMPLPDYLIFKHQEKISNGNISERATALREVLRVRDSLDAFERSLLLSEISRACGVSIGELEDVAALGESRESGDDERRVLAGCLKDDLSLMQAKSKIGRSDVWSLNQNRVIWNAITALKDKGAVELSADLVRSVAPKTVHLNGNLDSLFELEPQNFDYHLDRICDSGLRRSLVQTSRRLSVSALTSKPVGEVLSEHLAEVARVTSPASKVEFSAAEQAMSAMDYVHQRMESCDTLPGIDLGPTWKSLMNMTLGFQPSYMYMLSALPKVGKTNTMLNWAIEASVKRKVPALWINLEMSERDLVLRALSILSGLPNRRVRMGALTAPEKEKLDAAAELYQEAPLSCINGSSLSLQELINVIRRSVFVNGAKIVFLDYIQLVKHGNSKLAHWERHAEISTELKSLVTQLGIPLVAISQLSRGAMETDGSLLMGGSFKYAQDCDLAMQLKRCSPKDLEADPMGNLKLMIDLNRHGPADVYIRLNFNGDSLLCEEI